MGHRSQDELQLELNKALKKIKLGGLYYHYKHPDNFYIVEFLGYMEESEVVSVGYRGLFGNGILWIRTLDNFLSEVEVDGKRTRRFEEVKS